ncbi:hypothetical protein [Falsibacillus albus]|uniref:Uncharacterized protein n=1 Tax=Falsibacillus albus TaxID=2478915 RepID=A0A3L7JS93_9BACI|nr:hypothetical protein [Falsibacillus albus]RLQ93693.1 hypothetical protein D9X91_17080 [Falsibacillus albus]
MNKTAALSLIIFIASLLFLFFMQQLPNMSDVLSVGVTIIFLLSIMVSVLLGIAEKMKKEE